VTEADMAADAAVREAAARHLPDHAVVSEEGGEVCPSRPFLLLDPLDGTREFIMGGREFCVALALIDQGRPVAGAIVAPLLGVAWAGGETAWRVVLDDAGVPQGNPATIHAAPASTQRPLALVSRLHGDPDSDAVLGLLEPLDRRTVSSAVKFGMMAEGHGDLMVRSGAMKAWDIAAGEAILTAAGGVMRRRDGRGIVYDGANDWLCEPFFATSNAAMAERVTQVLQPPA
jgi:3'(2'), 5'-bisphosphate nucleotidase